MYILITGLMIVAIAYFLFRKRPIVASGSDQQQLSDYRELLNAHVAFYQHLDDTQKAKFEALVATFVQDYRMEGVGTEITDLDKVLIASSGVIPVFGFADWKYKNLTNIILYPDTFDNEFQFEGENRNIMGMVGSGYMNGQMLLSRAALQKGFSNSAGKENAAIHEFVHLLDKADGATDGVPENLLAHEYALPWLKMMHQEMHRIEEEKSDINPYALTNEAEFLAVAAEYFFEKPEQLQYKHPEIYETLRRVFGQDLAA
jgi:Mlc titration factor MtfA (ptsG expression regulator)